MKVKDLIKYLEYLNNPETEVQFKSPSGITWKILDEWTDSKTKNLININVK